MKGHLLRFEQPTFFRGWGLLPWWVSDLPFFPGVPCVRSDLGRR